MSKLSDKSDIILVIFGIIISIFIIIGIKNFSYYLFYKDMVQETIKEMVDSKYLK